MARCTLEVVKQTSAKTTVLKIVNLPEDLANAIKAAAYSKGNTLAEFMSEQFGDLVKRGAPKGTKKK